MFSNLATKYAIILRHMRQRVKIIIFVFVLITYKGKKVILCKVVLTKKSGRKSNINKLIYKFTYLKII